MAGMRTAAVLLALAAASCVVPPPRPPAPVLTLAPPPAERPQPAVSTDIMPDMNPTYPDIPTMPGLPPATASPVFSPPVPSNGSLAPGLSSGPVTGYGTGGMQSMPGAPPNPPYPAGGLMR